MTTLGLGAAKRQAIDETVRLRMAALLPTEDEPMVSEPSGREPTAGQPPEGGPVAAVPPAAVPPGAGPPESAHLPDPPGGGARLRFASALALDRRAVAGLAVLLLFAVGYAVQHFWLARPEAVAVPALAAASAPPEPGPPATDGPPGSGAGPPTGPAGPGAEPAVVIDVGGRVHLPGLHTLPGGSRVADALRAAGGPLPETDTRSLNLARVLMDGEQITVGEQALVPVPVPAPGGTGGLPGAGTPRPPVSLNRATLEQLDALPGVGPTLAQRILAYRASHGSFRSVDQLRQVSGIGARTFAELRPLLTL
ncbi:helix-hairpin-helix domain-containing protein [Kitasatospora sp. NPDC056076]|uniref:helix-hairpin-helix domain-containing protein n=1 Tax=Kitasatospora sp. NPDC056076 TaxID=3345703 RepID=UPI0035DE51FB